MAMAAHYHHIKMLGVKYARNLGIPQVSTSGATPMVMTMMIPTPRIKGNL
jgi:hypothetical protein